MTLPIRRLFAPPDTFSRFLLLLGFAFAVFIYVQRTELLDPYRNSDFYDFLLLLAAFLVLVFISFVYLLINRYAAPLVLLVLGVVVAIMLPLPPGPEERVFAAHRAELEELVELARQRQLAPETWDGQCTAHNEFAMPEGYEEFIASRCLRIGGREETLYVEIWPYWSYDALIYSADPMPVSGACDDYSGEGVPKQLDEHWFLCRRGRG
jgi:hypothetical protein